MIVRGRHPRLRQFGVAIAMLAPALVLFLVFVGYPAIDAFRVSTQEWTGFSPRPIEAGGRHYVELFGESTINALPWLVLATVACLAGMSLGRGMARSRDASRSRRGNRLARWSGIALAGVLLGMLLVWTYGPSAAKMVRGRSHSPRSSSFTFRQGVLPKFLSYHPWPVPSER